MDESGHTPPSAPFTLLARLRFLQRQTLLLFVLVAITIAAFVLTRSLAATSRSLHHSDGAQWHTIGQQRLADGDAAGAITALRHAAAADDDNRDVWVALANAYRAAGEPDAARDVLMELRGRLPDDPETNLRLARLEAAAGRPGEAIRYYQSALLGLWGPAQLAERRQLRIEFIEFLLDRGMEPRALSESLLLAGEMAETADAQVRVGELLLRAGDPARALKRFEAALALSPRDPDALVRAGEAAFASGNFRLADHYLARAPDSPRRQALRPVVELIVSLDPLLHGLGSRERHRRIAAAAERLAAEIDACRTERPDADPLAKEAAALRSELLRRSRNDDPVDADLNQVAALAGRAGAICDGGAPIVRALAIIAEHHGVSP